MCACVCVCVCVRVCVCESGKVLGRLQEHTGHIDDDDVEGIHARTRNDAHRHRHKHSKTKQKLIYIQILNKKGSGSRVLV